MSDDMALVREFAAGHSEPAFATLVERHLGLVHSAAVRQVHDAHLVEEINRNASNENAFRRRRCSLIRHSLAMDGPGELSAFAAPAIFGRCRVSTGLGDKQREALPEIMAGQWLAKPPWLGHRNMTTKLSS